MVSLDFSTARDNYRPPNWRDNCRAHACVSTHEHLAAWHTVAQGLLNPGQDPCQGCFIQPISSASIGRTGSCSTR